jgi:hypothetical protein
MSFKLKFTLYFPYILLLSALALGTQQQIHKYSTF